MITLIDTDRLASIECTDGENAAVLTINGAASEEEFVSSSSASANRHCYYMQIQVSN